VQDFVICLVLYDRILITPLVELGSNLLRGILDGGIADTSRLGGRRAWAETDPGLARFISTGRLFPTMAHHPLT
jgi:hypothetical protein